MASTPSTPETLATLDLDRALVSRLEDLGVRMDVSDPNTVAFKRVPVHADRFSKPRTNLLMQRLRGGMPFIVAVDEDLEYRGADERLARLFAGGVRQRGWRVLRIDGTAGARFADVLDRALRMLGFDGGEPELRTPGVDPGVDTRCPVRGSLTALLRDGTLQRTVGRTDLIDTLCAALLQWQTRLPVVVGLPGQGKTNLLHGVARRLAQARPAWDVTRVDLSEVLAGTLLDAERENLIAGLAAEATQADRVICVEHLELVQLALPQGPLLLTAALERGARMIGTVTPRALAALHALPPLARHLQVVEIAEPDRAFVRDILFACRDALVRHHQLGVSDAMLDAVLDRSETLDGHAPGIAIRLLDSTMSRASLDGARSVEQVHIYLAATGFTEANDHS